MSHRIRDAFAKAKNEGRGAFVAYLTMGFPTIEASERAADEAIAGGADILELGVPFSDPFADGGVIRSAAYEALRNGATLNGIIALAGRLRAKHPETGIVLFSYYNPVFSMGLDAFAEAVAGVGIDAVLVVDLPLEEREELLAQLRPRGVGFVPLIAPNTPLERVQASRESATRSSTSSPSRERPARGPRFRPTSRNGWTRYARRCICPSRRDSASPRARRPTRCRAMPTDSSWDPRSSSAWPRGGRRA